MALSDNDIAPYAEEMERLKENSLYSAQAYFEAAKFSEAASRLFVFLPALVSAVAGAIIATGGAKVWGVASAVSGAVAATASYLGSDRKSASYRASARRYTGLRHKLAFEIRILAHKETISDVEEVTRALAAEYQGCVAADDPVPNFLYEKARKRINSNIV
ncbi:hypothetical protein M4914_09480 [Streptomyces somaliensis DSM 40738]|uniref:SMODS and SLOG-associating 2TM effector domain-containing protein n=1 Tax=Streptomyces somaliensis (strain ATCC 33201 / DSM 40738 / JCM 12659 / KCTC 9044 / NCTC 11332 / NRRL B-12077 / IP 733) TaxID=1134445 RepID=A0AA44DBI6_STRE0|nr:hypothetical protein [Streptomyces somaliensis]MCQ0023154.1 hypothetical protein [Streptomyces somaliensis DSM 40738]NKY13242.1 hypothetical protein [Streptomyces somaliensis DSM 40738]